MRKFQAAVSYQLGPAQVHFSTPILAKNPYEAVDTLEKVLENAGYSLDPNDLLSIHISEEIKLEDFDSMGVHPFLSE